MGFSGVFLHWYVRKYQKRTTSTLQEYLCNDLEATIRALMTIATSSYGFYSSLTASPQPVTDTTMLVTMCSAIWTGYGLDSMLNKDNKMP